MSRLEDLVRDSLTAHEAGAPDAGGLLRNVHRRAQQRRHWEWVAAGLSATAVAALVVGLAAIVPGGGSPARPTHSPSPAASVPAGLQPVSYHGAQVLVPASWKVNDAHCGTPQHDTVLIEDGSPTLDCLVEQPPGLTVVRMTPADTPLGKDRATLATQPVTVDGQPARRGTGTPARQRGPLQVLVLPTVNVVISVESPDRTRAAQILDSTRLVPTDAHGCIDRMRSFGSATGATQPGADAQLVPGQPTSASICRYSEGWLTRSVLLSPADLNRFSGILNALPAGVSEPGPGYWEDQAGCAADETRASLVQFTYPKGSHVNVVVRLGGCRGLSATNGTRTTKISPALGRFLLDAVGYDSVLPDFSRLR